MEATAGTAQMTPTVFVPTKGTMKRKKDAEYPNEERGTVDEHYDRIPTTRHGEGDAKGNFYFDTSVYPLVAWFGSDTVTSPDSTNAPTAKKHALGLTDVPLSMTVFKSYHSVVHYAAYAMVEKWTMKWAAEKKLLEFDVTWKSLYPTKYAGAAITPTFTTTKSIPAYALAVTLGGSTTTDVNELTIEGDRKLSPFYALAGSQDFTRIDVGSRSLKVDMNARFDNDAEEENWANDVDRSLTVDVMGALIGGTTHQELNINVPTLSWDDAEIDTGKDNVMVKFKGTARALPGANLVNLFVVNTVASYSL